VVATIRAKGGDAQFAAWICAPRGACETRRRRHQSSAWEAWTFWSTMPAFSTRQCTRLPATSQWLDTMGGERQCAVLLEPRRGPKHIEAAGKGAIVKRRVRNGPQRRSQSCGLLRQQGSGDSDYPLAWPWIMRATTSASIPCCPRRDPTTRMVDEHSRQNAAATSR